MSKINDGGSAFPESAFGPLPNGEFGYGQPGMTLRDYIASSALPAIIQSEAALGYDIFTESAELAYKMADSMLATRQAKGEAK